MSGAASYHGGLAAEDQVASTYLAKGYTLAAKRFRGQAGEIDLILRDGAGLVFVEVKKSRSFAKAAIALSDRQISRIVGTAEEFMGGEPDGQNTQARFDVALVDGAGQVRILDNAITG